MNSESTGATATYARSESAYAGSAASRFRSIARSERWRVKNLLFWATLSTPRPEIAADAGLRLSPRLRRILDAREVA